MRKAIKDVILEDVRNFNSIVNGANKTINESGVNRMLQWLNDCDCAFITAFRKTFKDIRNRDKTYFGTNGDWKEGKSFTHEENRQKNKIMVAELLQLGYGVTKMKGVYPESDEVDDSEESYLVVNRNNDKDFLENLKRLAEYYNHDSICYKAKGEKQCHLIGTNDCGWTEYHVEGDGSDLHTGMASNYMSRLGNKAFTFLGLDSKKMNNRKEAMDNIKKTKGTDEEWRQRHWFDDDENTFQLRKEHRKSQLKEAVTFWRNMTCGQMMISEDLHPLTKKVMSEAIRRYKNGR